MASWAFSSSQEQLNFTKYAADAEAGWRLAEDDIAAGHLRFIWHGEPPSVPDWHRQYHRLLGERLGVNGFDLIPVPATGAGVMIFLEGHRRRVVAELEKRFGVGILERLRWEAREAHQKCLAERDQQPP